jgi:hypothetical protein
MYVSLLVESQVVSHRNTYRDRRQCTVRLFPYECRIDWSDLHRAPLPGTRRHEGLVACAACNTRCGTLVRPGRETSTTRPIESAYGKNKMIVHLKRRGCVQHAPGPPCHVFTPGAGSQVSYMFLPQRVFAALVDDCTNFDRCICSRSIPSVEAGERSRILLEAVCNCAGRGLLLANS